MIQQKQKSDTPTDRNASNTFSSQYLSASSREVSHNTSIRDLHLAKLKSKNTAHYKHKRPPSCQAASIHQPALACEHTTSIRDLHIAKLKSKNTAHYKHISKADYLVECAECISGFRRWSTIKHVFLYSEKNKKITRVNSSAAGETTALDR